ncbi:MAG: hypothetical protein NUV65_02075 [Candidatus Roizmanbacteria bacterium]|nr:hypothetical protein [Candidatus Roizmanbacteria bacterium]
MLKLSTADSEINEACNKIYNKNIVASLLRNNPKKTYIERFVEENRLECLLPTLTNPLYKNECSKYMKNLMNVLEVFKKMVGKKKFIIIKTLSSYPHITSDIDIVMEEREDVLEISKKISFLKLPIEVDINSVISWTPSQEISKRFIWNNIQYHYLDGEKYLVPNPNLDTLIRIGHVPFELAEIRLGELLHIFSQMSKIDMSALKVEAKKMGWINTFNNMVFIINSLYKSLYSETGRYISFPYKLSYLTLFKAMVEKKAWYKIWGARYIIRDRLGI